MKDFRAIRACILAFVLGAVMPLALSQTAGRTASSGAMTADKAQVEVDFWKSVERMNSVEAYNAYIEAYPGGRFVPLARIAIKTLSLATAVVASPKGQDIVKAPEAAAQPSISVPASPASRSARTELQSYAEPVSSGAISLSMGNRIRGPGVITLGRFLSKKQLPVPEGEWVVLAATDYDSDSQPKYANGSTGGLLLGMGSIKMMSVTLAQFEGRVVKSVLTASTNRLSADFRSYNWKDLRSCEVNSPQFAVQDTQDGFFRKTCMFVRPGVKTTLRDQVVSSHWAEVANTLSKLGAELRDFHIESSFFVADTQASYLRVTRLDCREPKSGEPACTQEARIDWAKKYSPSVTDGFKRDLSLPELSALGLGTEVSAE